MDKIVIKGARENNLKNVNLTLPKNKLIVMTGLSGSGKSSLAFDTIYQEGQRRFVESLSSYARQFLGGMEKPDVDLIEGLSPAISIDQKTTSKNPRSTVGTVTEIYDYLRLLFARIGVPYCPEHKTPIESQSIEEMVNKTLELPIGSRILICSPTVVREKGTFKKTIEDYIKDGYVRARIDGEVVELSEVSELEKNKKHDIDLLIDRVILKADSRSRVAEAIELSCKLANGKCKIVMDDKEVFYFSEHFACKFCNYTISELEPRIFSFNSPLGACCECHGLGVKLEISEDLLINGDKSINGGAIEPYKNVEESNLAFEELRQVCAHYNIDMDLPFNELSDEAKDIIFYGSKEPISFKMQSKSGRNHDKVTYYEGVINHFNRRYMETSSEWIRDWIEGFMVEKECSCCHGARMNEQVLNIFINGKNIYDLCSMSIFDLRNFLLNLELNEEEKVISKNIIKEATDRLEFLVNVGLDYLTLARSAGTLSGGEAQRIRLATQIGSRLTGVLYVLDEPSIGLHQKDNRKLINSLKEMRDLGNTLIVVEHDEETMLEADYLVDIGPGAGVWGGNIVACGTPSEVMKSETSITAKYLRGEYFIEVPKTRHPGNGKFIEIIGARENNLKGIDVKIPCGAITCVTGVSGSGKSSLINEVLFKNMYTKLYKAKKIYPGKVDKILGTDVFDRIIDISQSPIGRTPRSNPATYTGVFDDIRDLFSKTNEAKARGYDKGRFSFNVKGGRCEACWGDGVKKITMNFLPDVYVKCEVCKGSRYNRETLEVKYNDKTISDVLEMTIEDALKFFENHQKIKTKLQALYDVGLGYLKLGQSSTLLSGGEAQRIKLASELQSRISDKTLYILDEPTTGLHIDDIKRLMIMIDRLRAGGATVIIIEHNLDVIKLADYIVDLGPCGGEKGGNLIFQGTPEELVKVKESATGEYLKHYLK